MCHSRGSRFAAHFLAVPGKPHFREPKPQLHSAKKHLPGKSGRAAQPTVHGPGREAVAITAHRGSSPRGQSKHWSARRELSALHLSEGPTSEVADAEKASG